MSELCKDSIILIDKPVGITSFDVVKKLKNIIGIKKIGHAGVLDKPASGLLVCASGRATKLLSLFEANYKIYTVDIALGIKTDTYDLTGNIIKEKDASHITKKDIEKIIKEFVGEITQTVPPYSNIKIKGKRLYKYTLSNETVELPKRRIFIYGIEIINFTDNVVTLTIKCSKGTYIRSLSNDIGEKLCVYGCVQSLRRIFIYPFSLEDAGDLKHIKQMSINDALSFLPSLRIPEDLTPKVKNGVAFDRIFKCGSLENGLYRILNSSDKLSAVIEKNYNRVSYRFISLNM